METDQYLEFSATVEKFNSNLWSYHLSVPEPVARVFVNKDSRRVICTLNETVDFQCALMPKGDGSFFINLNKKLRDSLGLKIGTAVRVKLSKDSSTYGLPMPEEFKALLEMDTEGNNLFHALTPGKQRTLLYIIGSVKNPDSRIGRAVAVVEHLKRNHGKINYRQLNSDLKNAL